MNENIEITDEMLDHGCECIGDCDSPCRLFVVGTLKSSCIQALSKALKSERAARKNNPGVWDNAPEWAAMMSFDYYTLDGKKIGEQLASHGVYTRELPKTLEREIAEKIGNERAEKVSWNKESTKYMIDSIESAINEYRESVK